MTRPLVIDNFAGAPRGGDRVDDRMPIWSWKKRGPGRYEVRISGFRVATFATQRDAERMIKASQYAIEVL